jgi:hypothetical protein
MVFTGDAGATYHRALLALLTRFVVALGFAQPLSSSDVRIARWSGVVALSGEGRGRRVDAANGDQ